MYYIYIVTLFLLNWKGMDFMRKKIAILSLCIAFVLGIPFKWVQYKGEEGVSIFRIVDLGIHNMFFDFSLLSLNALALYFVLSKIQKTDKKSLQK